MSNVFSPIISIAIITAAGLGLSSLLLLLLLGRLKGPDLIMG